MKSLSLLLAIALLGAAQAQPTQVFVDFGSTTTPNEPNRVWNNYASVSEGANIPNLLTATGAPSGFSIFTLSRFNTVNTQGTTGSAVFPATATSDSLVGNLETFGGLSNIIPQIQLTGLLPDVAYSFTFFASRTGVADNRETAYTLVGGNSGVGFLNASNNLNNTATVAGIVADAQGQITLTLTAGPNNNNANHFTYLGVMVVSYETIPEPGTVALLGAAGVGALLAWRRRRRLHGAALALCLGVLAAGPATAGQIMINYGGTATGSGVWNNSASPAAAAAYGSLGSLVDFVSGANTGISMTIANGSHFGDPANHAGTSTVTGAAAAAGFNGSSGLDSFYSSTNNFNGSTANPRVTFSGLDLGQVYTFTIFASRIGAGGDNRTGLYTLIGASTVSGTLNASENTSQVLVLSGLTPDASGRIVLSLARDLANTNASGFTYLNALRIDSSPVPEPATCVLLGAAGLAAGIWRRRSTS